MTRGKLETGRRAASTLGGEVMGNVCLDAQLSSHHGKILAKRLRLTSSTCLSFAVRLRPCRGPGSSFGPSAALETFKKSASLAHASRMYAQTNPQLLILREGRGNLVT